MSRCDLHVHSRYSTRSEEWLFRRFDIPDSYSDPAAIYHGCRAAGMDFVTITDHDTIEGALRLSEFPGTFLSEQLTTFFPQDSCKIHLLVWGISELQHREMSALRENIYELQAYLSAA
ncbi:MAG: PHP domain-containing protein, partial [Verrucomicrobiota bacterium]|nr:PHP domain-containing protein [Verrucomicrobiota bacterium]